MCETLRIFLLINSLSLVSFIILNERESRVQLDSILIKTKSTKNYCFYDITSEREEFRQVTSLTYILVHIFFSGRVYYKAQEQEEHKSN